MRILLIDKTHEILEERLREAGHDLVEGYAMGREEALAGMAAFDGIVVRSRFPIDQAFLEHCGHLRFIARFGSGMENIDVPFAQKLGIACLNAPEGNREAVAEHALGMILALFRNLRRADEEVRNGVWRRKENMGLEISGKTVGIIGYGNMGSAFARVLSGLGCRVIAHDKYVQGFARPGVEEVDLKRIFEESEILSLHLPLTEETHHYADPAFFRSFRKPITFISTCRGKVTDTNALAHALEEGRVTGACLDVLESEKSSFEGLVAEGSISSGLQYLIEQRDRVILSPHIAGWTHEAFEKMANILADKILVQDA